MNKQDMIAFFDQWAPDWDADMIRDDQKIRRILDAACVFPGARVLDVACGTGVLFPDYMERQPQCVIAVDIAPNMAQIAQQKAQGTCISVRCGDVETIGFDAQFDSIVIYNAFPHFENPARLIDRLCALLAPGGTLCIAHGMSLQALEKHHERARHVSRPMLSEAELGALLARHLRITTSISDDEKFIVAAKRI